MGSRQRRVLAALGVGCVFALCQPAWGAAAVGAITTVCVGAVTITYSPPLMTSPASVVESANASGTLSCTGLQSGSGSITAQGPTTPGAACETPIAVTAGTGTLQVGGNTYPETIWAAAGTADMQMWVFSDLTGASPAAEAVGAAASLSPAGDLETCAVNGSLAAVTVTAVVVIFA